MKTMETPRARVGFGPQAVALFLVLCLAGAMAIEPTRRLLEQRARIAGMSADLSGLEQSNKRLEGRINRLNDPDYLEQQAREQIGLVRPGEITYRVMPPARPKKAEAAASERPEQVSVEEPRGFLARLARFIGF